MKENIFVAWVRNKELVDYKYTQESGALRKLEQFLMLNVRFLLWKYVDYISCKPQVLNLNRVNRPLVWGIPQTVINQWCS